MAWRTAGRLGPGGGPSGAFFPPSRRCETSALEEGEGDHSHERVPVQARPRATLEVVEAEFLRNPPASTAALALDDRGWLVCA